MRVEACVCGGIIAAPSLKASAPYVEAHNWTPVHRPWRAVVIEAARFVMPVSAELWAELIPSGPPTYRDPRRRSTAGNASRDVSGNTPRTSTGGEGAA